jgi:hypothetical protein
MVTRKDLIIAVLATFCLTATLFIILPSRSAEPYNPWGDVSGPTIGEPDGTINMRDINYEILRFNTFGDTAKNVTIAGHANKLAYSIENHTIISADIWQTPYLLVDGYSKIVVSIKCAATDGEYLATCRHRGASYSYIMDSVSAPLPHTFIKVYDVPNQEVSFTYLNMELYSVQLWADVYLIA